MEHYLYKQHVWFQKILFNPFIIWTSQYLKLPDDFGSSIQSEKQVNVNGKINFVHGTRQFLSNSIISQKPEVGKIFIFPNYLMHSVYPFYGEGERRSVSFNAYINDEVYDIYSQE